MTIYKPSCGERVQFTDYGLQTVGGLNTGKQIDAQVAGIKVLKVERAHTTPECWAVELDAPFNHLLVTGADIKPMRISK